MTTDTEWEPRHCRFDVGSLGGGNMMLEVGDKSFSVEDFSVKCFVLGNAGEVDIHEWSSEQRFDAAERALVGKIDEDMDEVLVVKPISGFKHELHVYVHRKNAVDALKEAVGQ